MLLEVRGDRVRERTNLLLASVEMLEDRELSIKELARLLNRSREPDPVAVAGERLGVDTVRRQPVLNSLDTVGRRFHVGLDLFTKIVSVVSFRYYALRTWSMVMCLP
jgi:hypothetical protein